MHGMVLMAMMKMMKEPQTSIKMMKEPQTSMKMMKEVMIMLKTAMTRALYIGRWCGSRGGYLMVHSIRNLRNSFLFLN